MRSDLRWLADALVLYYADSGRVATRTEILRLRHDQLGPQQMHGIGFTATEDGFTARVVRPDRTTTECWINFTRLDQSTLGWSDPQCTPRPNDFNRPLAITYAALLALALLARVLRHREGTRRMTSQFLGRLAVLSLAHPFWPLPRMSWCQESWQTTLRIAWLVVVTWYFLRSAIDDEDDEHTPRPRRAAPKPAAPPLAP